MTASAQNPSSNVAEWQQDRGWGRKQGKGHSLLVLKKQLGNAAFDLCLQPFGQNLVTWLELAAREKLGNRVYFVWLGVQLKIRGFISVQEGENGYEGQQWSLSQMRTLCVSTSISLWCEDSVGTDMVSPTRLQAPQEAGGYVTSP